MKKSLLATAAAVALIAGPALAQKQEGPASKVEAPAPAPKAVQNAPAEKVAPDKAVEHKAPDAKPMTTGQAAPRVDDKKAESAPANKNAQTPSSPAAAKSAADSKTDIKADVKASDTKAAPSTTAQGSASSSGASVSLTAEQKTKIRSTVLTGSAPRVTNVNFSLNVGTAVPRSVRVVAVPPTLIDIHPQWRGYMYFVVNDEIIIVEPNSLRIVAVIAV